MSDIEFDDRLFDLEYQLERRPAPVVDGAALVDMFDRAAANEP